MVKEIQPIQIWNNGVLMTATKYSLISTNDNFDVSAILYYELQTQDNIYVTSGNQTIDGQDYVDWNNDPDANAWIINWSSTKLGLTIIP